MSASYDPTLPSPLDQVRFLLGDTDTSDAMLSDQEITALLGLYSSTAEAAAQGARSLSARYARQVDREVGDLKVMFSQRAKHFADLAEIIDTGQEKRLAVMASGIFTGVDRPSNFVIGQHDRSPLPKKRWT